MKTDKRIERFPMRSRKPGRNKNKKDPKLVVRAISAASQKGRLQLGPWQLPCALGRGVKALKREGDCAVPRGRFALRQVFYRGRAAARPRTVLDLRATRPNDGWCDSPSDRNYNRRVDLPYGSSAEKLWRDDGLYDVVVVLGYNDTPRIRNRGSAIFLHVARAGFRPTEGCVALREADLRRVLSVLGRKSHIIIEV